MAKPRPFIAIVQSKGGVGATTLALETFTLLPPPAAIIETAGQGMLGHVAPAGAALTEAGAYARQGSGMAGALAAERNDRLCIGCEPVSYAVYEPHGIAAVARTASQFRYTVCDAGRWEAACPEILGHATHIWVVVTPDARSVMQAMAFLGPRRDLQEKVTLVENFSEGPSAITTTAFPVVYLPRLPASHGSGGLLKNTGAYGLALETALGAIFPDAQPEEPRDEAEAGITRALWRTARAAWAGRKVKREG